ncbi:MAG: hypothetical protein WDZ63_06440 [Burkholderiales bacterium]
MKTTLLVLVAAVLGTAALASNAGRDPLQMQRQKQSYERLQHDREQMQAMMDQCAKIMRTGHGMMHEHDEGKAPQAGGDAS